MVEANTLMPLAQIYCTATVTFCVLQVDIPRKKYADEIIYQYIVRTDIDEVIH